MVCISVHTIPAPCLPAVSPSYAGSGHCVMGLLSPTVAFYLEGRRVVYCQQARRTNKHISWWAHLSCLQSLPGNPAPEPGLMRALRLLGCLHVLRPRLAPTLAQFLEGGPNSLPSPSRWGPADLWACCSWCPARRWANSGSWSSTGRRTTAEASVSYRTETSSLTRWSGWLVGQLEQLTDPPLHLCSSLLGSRVASEADQMDPAAVRQWFKSLEALRKLPAEKYPCF